MLSDEERLERFSMLPPIDRFPTPRPEIVAELRSILEPRNVAEEEPGGLHEACDRLRGQAATILARMRSYPPVKVARYQDGPNVRPTAAPALASSARHFDRARPSQPEGATEETP